MGTNYYMHTKPPCPHCGAQTGEALHIGKSSRGWCFALRVHPREGINTLNDWKERWSAEGAYIRNEYGDQVTPVEMEKTITDRSSQYEWWDESLFHAFGYESELHFHTSNYSQRGPNGLARHAICERNGCIGHGEGTWDYINSDFS